VEAPTPPPVQKPEEPTGPATLTAVSPRILKKGSTMVLDVHGSGFRADHKARFARPKDTQSVFNVVRQRVVSSGLMQVIVQVDAAAGPGTVLFALVDAQGQQSNILNLEIAK
jgi:hypothetical protein